ncbi:hypothetical protein AAG570_009732 [Ranatra chinensis]|uniref:Major facilitator superfamily (MFS) profile domain-containing protein n=1 Tax=Ranatra chinensis TaxID=642074 RepID=A0ABD0Z2X2_9HEMI
MLLSGEAILTVSAEEGSWISALLPVGALLGAPITGKIADTIGRKYTLLSQGILLLLSWILILTGESVYLLYVARLLAGISVGVSTSVSPMYISEIAEEDLKGSLCSYTQLMLVSGVLYGYAVGAFFSYRTMAILCELIPIVFLLSFVGAPESPVYSLWLGRRREAERSLARLRGGSDRILGELVSLEYKFVLKTGALCVSLMACQQFSGINVVIFYCTAIFTEAGGGLVAPGYASLMVGATQVLASYFSTVLLHHVGRKPLLIASSSLMGISLMILGAYFNQKSYAASMPWLYWVPLIVVNLYVAAFSLGLGAVPFVVLGEILPAETKGVVSGLSVAVNWATAFVVVKSFDSLNTALGSDWTYWIFGILCVIMTLFFKMCMVETRGKSLETIREELSSDYRSTGYVGI